MTSGSHRRRLENAKYVGGPPVARGSRLQRLFKRHPGAKRTLKRAAKVLVVAGGLALLGRRAGRQGWRARSTLRKLIRAERALTPEAGPGLQRAARLRLWKRIDEAVRRAQKSRDRVYRVKVAGGVLGALGIPWAGSPMIDDYRRRALLRHPEPTHTQLYIRKNGVVRRFSA